MAIGPIQFMAIRFIELQVEALVAARLIEGAALEEAAQVVSTALAVEAAVAGES